MTKNEFIDLMVGEFLAAHTAWRKFYENRREYMQAVGREIGPRCLVFIDFSARPDRYWFGHGVGWCPSAAHFQEWRQRRVNPPVYKRSGSLQRLKTLPAPRDFENDEMRLDTFQLYRPFATYDLEKTPAEQLRSEIAGEIDEFALPYLRMMLQARHGLELTQAELSNHRHAG